MILKQKEIFNKFEDEKIKEITNLDKKKVNPEDLIYKYKGSSSDANFNKFDK